MDLFFGGGSSPYEERGRGGGSKTTKRRRSRRNRQYQQKDQNDDVSKEWEDKRNEEEMIEEGESGSSSLSDFDVDDEGSTCLECGGGDFFEDQLGRLTCKTCGTLNEQRLTQSQVLSEYNTKNVGRDFGGHAVKSKSSSKDNQIAGMDQYHKPPSLNVVHCLEAAQFVLQKQATFMISRFRCAETVRSRLRSLWFSFLERVVAEKTHPVANATTDDRILHFFGINMRGSVRNDQDSYQPSDARQWLHHGLATTVYLIYLACRQLHEPVMLSDLIRVCCRGDMPYLASYHTLPIVLRWRVFRARRFFLPGCFRVKEEDLFPSVETATRYCDQLASTLFGKRKLFHLPAPNWGLCAVRMAKTIAMDDEEIKCALQIWSRWSTQITSRATRGPPEVAVVAALIVGIRMCSHRGGWYARWIRKINRRYVDDPIRIQDYLNKCEMYFFRGKCSTQYVQHLATAAAALNRSDGPAPAKQTKVEGKRPADTTVSTATRRWHERIESLWSRTSASQVCEYLSRIGSTGANESMGDRLNARPYTTDSVVSRASSLDHGDSDVGTYLIYKPRWNSQCPQEERFWSYAPRYVRLVRHCANAFSCRCDAIIGAIEYLETLMWPSKGY